MSSRPVLLLVDDDPGVRRVIRQMLRGTKYVVREAADGPQALAAVATTPPDVILLDIVLPGLSGLEVLDRLHASGRTAAISVIAMTGSIEPGPVMIAMGACGVLRKPFSVRELRQALDAAAARATVA